MNKYPGIEDFKRSRREFEGIIDSYQSKAKTGWICPKCNRVWSPDVEECWYCNDSLSLKKSSDNICAKCHKPAVHQLLGGDWLCDACYYLQQ